MFLITSSHQVCSCTSQFLRRLDDHTVVRRVCFKAVWPTSPREFIICTTWMEQPDGSVLIASRSPPDSECPPVRDGYVRGHIRISGYWIQPIRKKIKGQKMNRSGQEEQQCKTTVVSHTDLGGNVPSYIVNMLVTNAFPNMLSTVSRVASEGRK